MRKIDFVVVHCADSTDNPFSSKYDWDPSEIRADHIKRGFNDIGYHYVIRRDGTIFIGRDEKKQGAHVKGFNKRSIGICLVGRRHFTTAQMDTLFSLYLNIKNRHGIESKNWHGHYEFDAGKTCPNLDMDQVRDKLESL